MNNGIYFLTLVTGLFFVLTGWRKLFVRETHAQVWSLFAELGVPEPLRWCAVLAEYFGGFALMLGEGTVMKVAAALLLFVMLVAVSIDVYPQVWRKQSRPIQPTRCASNLMCTPETQLIFILLAILIGG